MPEGTPPVSAPSTSNGEEVGALLPSRMDQLPTVEEEEELEVGPTLPQAKKRKVRRSSGTFIGMGHPGFLTLK